ncbi:ATP/GTP-binding protein [Pseudactinotalea sp. HY158]|uniref:AAA family ATPase n=1 Tax=Pseudactinotalea sp. HY158 TaxID=2654547 RepID=UPI00129D1072|nr:ATP-binding protein [Pseudactinotalea sp. HY158]QGH69327.1 AAA family ATPase [Pseudactinotalea sp. HY158]
MMLLSFTVQNHRSLRDELTIDLTRPTLRTLRPRAGEDWRSHVYPLAGVFGANATGKSAILDALTYTFTAIHSSATIWQASRTMPRVPFALDDESPEKVSTYRLDFVHADRRHEYGFEVDDTGVVREWLRDIPGTRWRTLLERVSGDGTLRTHGSVRPLGAITRRELALSRALLLEHPQLGPIARNLVRSFDSLSVRDEDRERRLAALPRSLLERDVTFDTIVSLLQVADIGVVDVDVQEDEVPATLREILREVTQRLREDEGDEPAPLNALEDDESDAVVRSLVFTHQGTASEQRRFSIGDESDGTIAWLAIIVPALEILRRGGVFCVDEIDSSLHPHLVDVLLGAFSDPEINTKGAQLLFTSHDTYILSPLSQVDLEPEQVWFTEKTRDGATELSCLADFPRNKGANVARRYLLGRYGGTPRLAPSVLTALIRFKDA